MAGYSTKTLSQKLGIKEGYKIILLNQPENYGDILFPFPDNCSIFDTLSQDADFIQFFTENKKDLEIQFPHLKKSLKKDGSLWISWPKTLRQAQGKKQIPADLNENSIRDIGLQNGLVDVKVVAIDEKWSGLKFIYRLKDR